MIADSHTHAVGADRQRYPLDRTGLPGGEWVDRSPDAEGLVAAFDTGSVGRGVLVQPNGAYRFDNRYVVDAAAAHPRRLWSMVTVDAGAADAVVELERLAHAGARGVRLFSIPTPEPANRWLSPDGLRDLLAVADQHDLVVAACVLPDELDAALALASTSARPMLLDHGAFVDLMGPDLDRIAAVDTVVVKLTTHVLDTHRAAGVAGPELVERLVARLGSDRIVWGSDYAQTHDRPYRALVELAHEAVAAVGDEAGEKILGRTLVQLFGG